MRCAASGDNNSQMLGGMRGVCDRPYVRSGQHVDLFPVLKYSISPPIVEKRGPEPFPSSPTRGERWNIIIYNTLREREREREMGARGDLFLFLTLSVDWCGGYYHPLGFTRLLHLPPHRIYKLIASAGCLRQLWGLSLSFSVRKTDCSLDRAGVCFALRPQALNPSSPTYAHITPPIMQHRINSETLFY